MLNDSYNIQRHSALGGPNPFRFAQWRSIRHVDWRVKQFAVFGYKIFNVMAAGFVGSTKNFPFSFDVDVEEEEEPGRSTPHLSKRIG